MTTVALPAQFTLSSVLFVQNTSQRVGASPFAGSEQAVDLLNDRWTCHLEVPWKNYADAASIEAFIGAMRGQVNVVPLYHWVRPQPNGTMRGTLTLSAAAAQGAGSLTITGGAGQAGKTLLAGDMLGVGGLLLMVQSDCAANGSGVITVPITNRLRVAQTSGASVGWDRPTVLFRLLSTSGVQYIPNITNATTFDFGEKI